MNLNNKNEMSLENQSNYDDIYFKSTKTVILLKKQLREVRFKITCSFQEHKK